MSTGTSNKEWASNAERQLSEGLVDISDIHMNGVDCGERYCRARFIVEREDRVDVRDLLGLPVFRTEAFTVLGEENALDVYFTAPGVSLNDLKFEAWDELQ